MSSYNLTVQRVTTRPVAIALAHRLDRIAPEPDRDALIAVVIDQDGTSYPEMTLFEIEDGVFDTLTTVKAQNLSGEALNSLLTSANRTAADVDHYV